MDQELEVRYTIRTYSRRGCRTEGPLLDRERALSLAEYLDCTRRFHRVEVEERFYDAVARRDVVTTVFSSRHFRVEPLAWLLLLGSVAAATATFYLTRWALTTFALS